MDEVEELRAVVWAAAPVPFVALAVREHDAESSAWAEVRRRRDRHPLGVAPDSADAIFAAARGESPCSPAISSDAAAAGRRCRQGVPGAEPLPPLTAREREIADLLALGLTNKEIAARLFLGVSTVKNHVHNLLCKLDVSSRVEAVARMNRASSVMDVAMRAAAARPAVAGGPTA